MAEMVHETHQISAPATAIHKATMTLPMALGLAGGVGVFVFVFMAYVGNITKPIIDQQEKNKDGLQALTANVSTLTDNVKQISADFSREIIELKAVFKEGTDQRYKSTQAALKSCIDANNNPGMEFYNPMGEMPQTFRAKGLGWKPTITKE